MAEQKIRAMLAEFMIAKDLNHKNIIKYMYLMKEYNFEK